MDTGALHQFHDPGQEHALPVTDGIHFHFPAHDILVHQDRAVLIHFHRVFEIMLQHLPVGHDLHGPAPQHEAGTYQHRIADVLRGPDPVGNVGHRHPLRVGDLQGFDDMLEGIPVLRTEDGRRIRAQDLHSPLFQRFRQIHRRLASQRGDDSQRLFQLHDVEDILHGEGLEIELVGTGIVRGHRLRVVVDDDGLIPHLMDGLHRVDGGIIEFHALPDADGAGAQYDDLLMGGDHGFVLLFVGGIEIRDIAVKFAGTGIDHLIHRRQMILPAQTEDLLLCAAGELRDIGVGESHALGP